MYIRTPAEINHNEICIITFPDKTAVTDLKTGSHSMRHFFNHLLQAYFTLLYVREHHKQCMLYKGKSCMGMQIGSGITWNSFQFTVCISKKSFFCQRVRGMIRCDQVKTVIQERLPQCLAIR